MTLDSSHSKPILVTGAAGAIGSIGRNLTDMLLAKGHRVRALVRRENDRAGALRQLGAEAVQGIRAIEGCTRVYFGMSVSADLGVDQQLSHLDQFASQARGAKRYGVAVGPVDQKCKLVAKLTGIACPKRARQDAEAFANLLLIVASDLCAGMLPIRKFSREIDERTAAKLWICDLFGDAFEQGFDLPARCADVALRDLIPPPPEPPVLLLSKSRDQFVLGGKGSVKRRLRNPGARDDRVDADSANTFRVEELNGDLNQTLAS
jgi:NAD(P)-dependent dehydrogenase (short-subunit alcohol dehydrogenase family)